MKHEIEIQDLPEGWEAVAYRCAYGNEHIFNRGMVDQISSSISKTSTERLIVRKKQPRRIVLEEVEAGHEKVEFFHDRRYWKIVEDGK